MRISKIALYQGAEEYKTLHTTVGRLPIHAHIHTLLVTSYYIVARAALGQYVRSKAIMYQRC